MQRTSNSGFDGQMPCLITIRSHRKYSGLSQDVQNTYILMKMTLRHLLKSSLSVMIAIKQLINMIHKALDFEIKYTLGFCTSQDKVLMLLRNYPPNAMLWNGLGGKIEKDEKPDENIRKELFEESGLQVEVKNESYKGIVKWNIQDEGRIGGTHLFVFHLPNIIEINNLIASEEGLLAWKDIDWTLDPKNTEIVENIPYFLQDALQLDTPKIFSFVYEKNNSLIEYTVKDLL